MKDGAIKALESKGTVVVQFMMQTCPPCKKLEPALREFAAETGIPVVQVDCGVKTFDKTADRHKVMVTPTVIVLKGGKEVARGIPTTKRGLARIVKRGEKA